MAGKYRRDMKLGQLLVYLGRDEDPDAADRIQICFEKDEWDQFVEVPANSPLLKPFENYVVACMGAEDSRDENDLPAIRVSIREDGAEKDHA